MADLTEHVDGLIHEPTQTGDGIDLTAEYVARIEYGGDIDFGGDEYHPPETDAVGLDYRDEDDEYGWWELDAGTYLVRYNETLSDPDEPLLLAPHPRFTALGVTHPTLRVRELPRIPLTVPEGGVDIKENARLSNLY